MSVTYVLYIHVSSGVHLCYLCTKFTYKRIISRQYDNIDEETDNLVEEKGDNLFCQWYLHQYD